MPDMAPSSSTLATLPNELIDKIVIEYLASAYDDQEATLRRGATAALKAAFRDHDLDDPAYVPSQVAMQRRKAQEIRLQLFAYVVAVVGTCHMPLTIGIQPTGVPTQQPLHNWKERFNVSIGDPLSYAKVVLQLAAVFRATCSLVKAVLQEQEAVANELYEDACAALAKFDTLHGVVCRVDEALRVANDCRVAEHFKVRLQDVRSLLEDECKVQRSCDSLASQAIVEGPIQVEPFEELPKKAGCRAALKACLVM